LGLIKAFRAGIKATIELLSGSQIGEALVSWVGLPRYELIVLFAFLCLAEGILGRVESNMSKLLYSVGQCRTAGFCIHILISIALETMKMM
jgi:hypothetical protein